MSQAIANGEVKVGATDLAGISEEVIESGQSSFGAYVASPTFSQYGYSWLRDGSFCALAMSAVGRSESARRFHDWTCNAVSALGDRLGEVTNSLELGHPVAAGQMMPTRFRLDGTEESGVKQWPNFQFDGYGTWLFAVYSCYGDALPDGLREVVVDVARYLAAGWRLPCYDYWEESGDKIHTSTLAAIAAGLRAAARMASDSAFDRAADDVTTFIKDKCVVGGAFVKGPEDHRVDGSLFSLAVPFGLVSIDDPLFIATNRRIKDELSSPSGGIRRYLSDDYYGGGPWVLLTAWSGWCERIFGDETAYRARVAWVESHASHDGTLAEQIVAEAQFPQFVAKWTNRWGPVADPLLWSHAMYLLMRFGPGPMIWKLNSPNTESAHVTCTRPFGARL